VHRGGGGPPALHLAEFTASLDVWNWNARIAASRHGSARASVVG
jgi:hypothetical protein